MDPASLYGSPNAVAPHYSRFGVSQRLLLTGHSHQAWPDCGFDGQMAAWLDAAQYVDDKWEQAFVQAERVREGFDKLLGDAGGCIALGANTHELVVRLLSALPLRTRPRLVTTDGEFHSIRRQLDRLEEEGLTIVRVPEAPLGSLATRLSRAVDDRTALVLVSAVFFDTGRIARGLADVAASCRRHGSRLLVDAYHALNVVPVSLADEGLGDAFVVGGGYKYCQLGEGNCFLRIPPDTDLRPVVTGWFSEFTVLADQQRAERVAYGQGGDRFAGATYDPTSHYRAVRVFDFFRERGLTPALLREVSQHQIGLLASVFDALDLDPAILSRDRACPLDDVGGFLALRSPVAAALVRSLHARGVWTDARGELLRLGPAPYLSDRQLRDAIGLLGEVVRENSGAAG
ncbi:MAG TPA: aminotransferase class V-fold PLP-dependent enzyme [Gemmatimonadales bacterium]|nr:aminotransferase class V-fold PLP-dependent enzyme [Gemmatimonadales bacterium]